MATKKLRPYFQAHTIVVLTGSLIKAILHKPDASRRLLKWAVELSEFDIEYRPRKSKQGAGAGQLRYGKFKRAFPESWNRKMGARDGWIILSPRWKHWNSPKDT